MLNNSKSMQKVGAKNTYWGNIKEAISSLFTGLRLSLRHLFDAKDRRTPLGVYENDYFEQKTGIFTLQYPHESIPVPENGRYRLHNEIEDCIVCDKCAKICPVDCIEIEPIKAIEEIGKTSDGTPKRIHAAKFDIDMGKCCFCGLCTTVCPTECLTMTKAYDFTEFDVADHIYAFAEMTPLEILEKQQALEKFNKEKELAKAAKAPATPAKEPTSDGPEKTAAAGKPVFKPRMPMKPKTAGTIKEEDEQEQDAKAKALELMKAKSKTDESASDGNNKVEEPESTKPKPPAAKKPGPIIKPKVPGKESPDIKETEENKNVKPASAKPVFRPRPMIKKPKGKEKDQ